MSTFPAKLTRLPADPEGFSELTEPYRRELQVHCYRILGSLHEAEDMVQETMLKAWKRIDTYEGRASVRAWLYKIATNTCLDFLDSKRSRRLLPFQVNAASDPLSPIQPPSPELTWLEPLPDEWLEDANAVNPEARYSESESVSLAFLTALQILPPRQRAVLILRDVLDFPAQETAEVLELTVSSANSALHRARKAISQHYQGDAMPAKRLAPADEISKQLLDHYVRVWESADIAGLVALLKQDAILAMPPSPSWYRGRTAIEKFSSVTFFGAEGMFTGIAKNRWRLIPTRANASPAFAIYIRNAEGKYEAFGLQVLEFSGREISIITNFIDATLLPRFGLPKSLA